MVPATGTPARASLRRSLVLATDVLSPALALARQAEQQGLHRVWTTEYTTRDAPVRALALGMSTTRLGVATGIAYAFTRLPVAMAATAADIQMVTGGRFALGLGAGTRGMRARFYGCDDFDHPGPRLAEYVRLMKSVWAAEGDLDFQGRFYRSRLPGPTRNAQLAETGPPPVFGSGLNRTMLRYAAASCDGVALHPLAAVSHYMDGTVAPALQQGWRDAPRELACWVITSIAHDAEVALERVKANLAFYFSTPSYQSVVEGTRWEPAAARIREAFARSGPQWSELARLVDDDMARAFSLSGSPAGVRDDARRWEAALARHGCTELVFQTVGIGLDDEETIDNCRLIIDSLGPGSAAGSAP